MENGSAVRGRTVWAMLFLRWGLALAGQCVFALAYVLGGARDPWRAAGDWWLVSFGLAEFFNVWLLARLAKSEGLRLRDLYSFGSRSTLKGDLLWLIPAFVGTAVVAGAPNTMLATALWGSPAASAAILFRPIAVWAAWPTVFVFPFIHAVTELPTYFGYVMPRLSKLTGKPWLAVLLCGMALSTQHIFLPLLFDWRYLVWRGLMFIPFALWMAFVLYKRRTLMPYLVAVHVLIDLILPIMVLTESLKVG